eukprot:CAMPEP_0172785514 /NCGR_PEP_ID=MMETSP1074-20121228/205482_1 /TAXON_ID=2916 /ORGANISM="Ceratium fusus, Strain PA161109" /LENGTH=422 /DNA_ID=CAMNT_0013622523 /DNA_START=27 /DNA_END=1291 /DNA_ORIENTATION=+
MNRLQRIAMHVLADDTNNGRVTLTPSATSATMSSVAKSDDDVVICCALRTPIAKANRGGFKDTPCEEMLAPLFKAVLDRTKVDPKAIGDIQIGNVSQPGAGAVTSRMAQFLGDLPYDVPLSTINRQCSSGLQAVANIAANIKAGVIDVGLAGGVESMSMYNMASGVDLSKFSAKIVDNAGAASCLMPMGITSENVAAAYNISKDQQNSLAAASHKKAVAAQKQGLFNEELVPVATKVKDKAGKETEVVVKADEGPREGTTLEGLNKLKPAFKAGGTTTAGNASQVSDGAALVLLARRSKIVDNAGAASCLMPMGITSENVAAAYNISKDQQNSLAAASHKKAVAAQKQGLFNEELVPVATKVKDKAGKETEVVVKADEGPREGTTLEGLNKLKPAFKAGGTTTAGNASQVSDGAALVLLARR